MYLGQATALDALMLSHSLKDAKDNLDIITQISSAYGLEINSEKSCVMIFNVREQPAAPLQY